MSFSKEEKQKAKSTTGIHIHTFKGVLGNVEGGIINQNFDINITKNSFPSLANYLKSKGVSPEDIIELEKTISEDPTPSSPEGYGEKNEWMDWKNGI